MLAISSTPFYNDVSFSYFRGNKSYNLKKDVTTIKLLLDVGLDHLIPYDSERGILDVGSNPLAPRLMAWIAENTDIYGLTLTFTLIFDYLLISAQAKEDFYKVVFNHVINKCSTKGFVARLYYWYKSVRDTQSIEDVIDPKDYQVSYEKDIDTLAPPIINKTRSSREAENIDALYEANIKDAIHPLYFFNAVHLFDCLPPKYHEPNLCSRTLKACYVLVLGGQFNTAVVATHEDLESVKASLYPFTTNVSGPTTASHSLSLLSVKKQSPLS
jgi:hypothetical protein